MATLARTLPIAVQRPRLPFRISRSVFFAIAVLWTGVALTPFILTVSGSFKSKSETLDWPPAIIPKECHLENTRVWNNSHYFPQIVNSVFLAAFHLDGLHRDLLDGRIRVRGCAPGSTVRSRLGSIMVPGQILWVPKF